MRSRLAVFLATILAVPAIAENVSVQLTCRSLQMEPAQYTSPVAGVGRVTTYFTTYNPSRSPLYDTRGGITYFSSEVRPRSGQAGVYETDYLVLQGNQITEYGSLTLNLSTADTNSNGLPDILEIGRAASIGITGSARSDQPSGVTYTAAGTSNRSAGSVRGSYSVTLTVTAGASGAAVIASNLNILATDPTRSTASYSRSPSGNFTFNLNFPSADGTSTTSTFTAPFTVTNANSIAIPAFAFVDSNGIRRITQASTLTRTGNTYAGNIRLIDGEPETSWADYLDWYLEIVDTNDSDRDGIPNLSDTIDATPTLTTQPVARSVVIGGSASFSAVATGSTPLTYQWFLNDNPIVGATSATLNLSNASQLNAGTYYVTVSNSLGSVSSDRVTLTVTTAPPVITAQPQNQAFAIGGSGAINAQASGSDLSYQWFLNENPILGANSSSYTLSKVQPSMAGSYKVRVSNSGGSATSNPGVVSIGQSSINDTFAGAAIDLNVWTSSQPFFDSRTDVAGGFLTLKNRGRLLSKSLTPSVYSVATRFRLSGSSFDQFAVFLRTNGSNNSGSFNSGVAVLFQIRSGDQGATGVNNIKISPVNTGEITSSYPLAMNTWYDAIIEDDGLTITVKINGIEAVRTQTSIRSGNQVGLQNREGSGGGSSISAGSTTDVDYISVTASAASNDAASDPAPRFANISTRGFVGTGIEALVCGFVTRGSRPQSLLIRAAGPALTAFGVGGALEDPQLQIFNSQSVTVGSNDNWSSLDAPAAQSVGAFAFGPNSRDAMINGAFAPGGYTVQVSGANGGTGTALVEAYDLNSSDQQIRLVNISTRGVVGTGGQNLIAGLVVTGTSPQKVLVRAVGPTLVPFGIPGALADPVLTVFNAGGTKIYESDDWGSQENAAAIATAATQTGAFSLLNNSRDAAILAYLPPGAYTFVISGKNGATGIALIEAYEVN